MSSPGPPSAEWTISQYETALLRVELPGDWTSIRLVLTSRTRQHRFDELPRAIGQDDAPGSPRPAPVWFEVPLALLERNGVRAHVAAGSGQKLELDWATVQASGPRTPEELMVATPDPGTPGGGRVLPPAAWEDQSTPDASPSDVAHAPGNGAVGHAAQPQRNGTAPHVAESSVARNGTAPHAADPSVARNGTAPHVADPPVVHDRTAPHAAPPLSSGPGVTLPAPPVHEPPPTPRRPVAPIAHTRPPVSQPPPPPTAHTRAVPRWPAVPTADTPPAPYDPPRRSRPPPVPSAPDPRPAAGRGGEPAYGRPAASTAPASDPARLRERLEALRADYRAIESRVAGHERRARPQSRFTRGDPPEPDARALAYTGPADDEPRP